MYLKSLTLRGFKSFASATTLHFEPGITCVVGPNGSGKSNVVDALAWVMGEQGAKSLRGGSMEDVIFAGTAKRAPLGRAEVVLTIDNADHALPIEYSEVTISRTKFRGGNSEYAINGTPSRLLDVRELLSDSGIGREMHVIVGQGQLDTILQATPEIRRGFIEEAAGVLKHRERKEKALRKLDSTEANLARLSDLVHEIRRQLKPLGRQAEVARRAGTIQAELRDAKARLLADDLVQATLALEGELADEARLAAQRAEVERALGDARTAEAQAEAAVAATGPRLAQSQDTWYALSTLAERIGATVSIAAERMRHADQQPADERTGRDPDTLDAEAADIAGAEQRLRGELDLRATALREATSASQATEIAHAEAEKRFTTQVRAVADRREGIAKLSGQVSSLASRADAASEQIERLRVAGAQAASRADEAVVKFAALEQEVTGLDAGEEHLDADYDTAQAALDRIDAQLESLRRDEQEASRARAASAARAEALRSGLERADGSAHLLAASADVAGLLGSVATLIQVAPGHETAISAALGWAADAVVVADPGVAVAAFELLKSRDLGQAGVLMPGPDLDETWPSLPSGAVYAVDLITADEQVSASLRRLLRQVAVVDGLDAASALVAVLPEVTAVTAAGDVLSSWFGHGGSSARPSLIEVQAAVDEAEAALAAAQARTEQVRFAIAAAQAQAEEAGRLVEDAEARLNDSDALHAAVAEQLGQLNQTARSARGEADRLQAQVTAAEEARDRDLAALAGLRERLEAAGNAGDVSEPDPAERDEKGAAARTARSAEMEARLALRTVEERARSLAGRAQSLRQAAQAERQARARELARRRRMAAEADAARAVQGSASWLLGRVQESRHLAEAERQGVRAELSAAEQTLAEARGSVRALAADLEKLVDSTHRDELARAQQRMRVEALAERAMAEVGIEAETLMADYGPHLGVPVLADADGTPIGDDERPEPVPFVREEQLRRARVAERHLTLLGRVNPLAMEEFEAMQERHAFLAEQLDDLKRTRADLLAIVEEVDARVQEVFAAAYTDVATQFELVFAELFPGGDGRLILTEPGQWLTTGVDVEARPAGKKVKRLSLLSGGERSLVAVAFLVSLFKARPSPFYILDEVEAALDDTNLGRLLGIYEELRASSQLLVITHQKRTMEIADALYGVTMAGDGVSTVISQRLRDPAV